MKVKEKKKGIIANLGKSIANAIKAFATDDDEKTEEILKDYKLQDVEKEAVENFKKRYETSVDRKTNIPKEKVENKIVKEKLSNQKSNNVKEEIERED